ncbi:MAG: dTDP-glucose 4,6-dehydratase [Pseudomonadota bacterium]
MRILVTGGCGFIGSNFIRYMLERYDYRILNLDALTYAGNLENLKGLETDSRYTFVKGFIQDPETVKKALRGVDCVVHFAAESHVDRSITDAHPFIQTNIAGTQVLIDACRCANTERFVHISTDEVYGSIEKGRFTEETPLTPNSPYSASKAGSDLLVRAAVKTHGFPAMITRCSNNYGPYQFPEKFVPLIITNALENRQIPLYGDGLNVRDWIYVGDHCSAIDAVVHHGKAGSVYNIGGEAERTNTEVIRTVLARLGKPDSLITLIDDRPGHDRRYAMDIGKMRSELNWSPPVPFEAGMDLTIDWYEKNEGWWRRVKSGEYKTYYKEMYEARIMRDKKP